MTSHIARFFRQPWFIRLWVFPIWLLLGLSKLCIVCLSFKSLTVLLGNYQADQFWVPLVTPAQHRKALLIGRLVRGVALYTPWNSNCFPQAITARMLLNFYGIPHGLYLGMAKQGQTYQAHAWLCAGKVRVTGGLSFQQFIPVGLFISPKNLSHHSMIVD